MHIAILSSIRAIFLVGFAFFPATVVLASPQTNEIAQFWDVAGTAQQAASAGLLQLKETDPDGYELYKTALPRFDSKELTRRLGDLAELHLTSHDISVITTFMQTPGGERMREIFKKNKTKDTLSSAIDSIPQKEREPVDVFMGSLSARIMLTVFLSTEAKQIGKQYGQELMCSYWSESDAKIFQQLVKLGKCGPSVVQQGVAPEKLAFASLRQFFR